MATVHRDAGAGVQSKAKLHGIHVVQVGPATGTAAETDGELDGDHLSWCLQVKSCR
ncbi:hypothetical protein [Haloquadratum walsbyi]|uniref:Uncharacterized protein n=1 Tax=Haloquadratum walsbyi J07HQW2 TaxID=1238425 RepID=U1PX38_9EURY|nr:hypothetical protein [Haloquadratum walsbyi]ERG97011.1 MAG: hypothetical protein J07HQW2_03497 [Haloquadratum walsbyi J07HQW2]